MWWEPEEDGTYHRRLFQVIDSLREDWFFYDWYRQCVSVYLGTDVGVLSPDSYDVVTRDTDSPRPFNAAKSAIDTILSMLESEPRPIFVTDGAEPGKQRAATDLSDAVWAVFAETDFYAKWYEVVADACKCGLGLLQVTHEILRDKKTARLLIERVYPYELLWDPRDAYNGRPRSWFRIKLWDERVALARWTNTGDKKRDEENRKIIVDTPTALGMFTAEAIDPAERNITRQILIAENIHLPSGDGCPDGLRVIATKAGDLGCEPWEEPDPPFVPVIWENAEVGFAGRGALFDAMGLQKSLDDIEGSLEHTFGTQSKPIIAVQENEDEASQKLSAEDILYVPYAINPPQRVTDPIVHPQALDRQTTRKGEVFEQLGVSQMDAAGLKQPGITAARAIRNLRQIASQRLSLKFKKLDRSVVEVTKRLVDESGRLKKAGYRVVSRLIEQDERGGRVKEFSWGELVADEAFQVTIEVASSTAKTLAGRNNDIEDLFNAGLLPPDLFLSQYQSPDLKDLLKRLNAPRDLVRQQLAKLLETRSTEADGVLPDEAQPNIELALKEAQYEWALACIRGDEPEVLDLLGEYVAHAGKLAQKKALGMMELQAEAQLRAQLKLSAPSNTNQMAAPMEGPPPAA